MNNARHTEYKSPAPGTLCHRLTRKKALRADDIRSYKKKGSVVMKYFTAILIVLMVLSLLGCSAQEADPVAAPLPETIDGNGPMEEVTELPSPEEKEQQQIITGPVQASGPEGSFCSLTTDYYSLSLPGSWGDCICVINYLDRGGYSASIHEYYGFKNFGGGKLCTLMMVPTDDKSYKDFPDYELLCALDTPEGSFYVVALFPTDVQFDEDTAADYNAMAEELMDVLYSIRPVGDIEMAIP